MAKKIPPSIFGLLLNSLLFAAGPLVAMDFDIIYVEETKLDIESRQIIFAILNVSEKIAHYLGNLVPEATLSVSIITITDKQDGHKEYYFQGKMHDKKEGYSIFSFQINCAKNECEFIPEVALPMVVLGDDAQRETKELITAMLNTITDLSRAYERSVHPKFIEVYQVTERKPFQGEVKKTVFKGYNKENKLSESTLYQYSSQFGKKVHYEFKITENSPN